MNRIIYTLLILCYLFPFSSVFSHIDFSDEISHFEHFLYHDKTLLDTSEFDSHPFWSRSTEINMATDNPTNENGKHIIVQPNWAKGNLKTVQWYYDVHREGRLDRLLGYIACRLGVIVHGDKNQDQLAIHLKAFDITRLLEAGPYKNDILSFAAQRLIYDSLKKYPRVFDIHLHNLGYDEGNYLNPKAAAFGYASWINYCTFLVLRYASGMTCPIGSTHEARKRIHLYAQNFPRLRGYILPIHKAILADGTIDWDNTGNFLTNQSGLVTATSFSSDHSELLPAVSVHPFDPQWREKLLRAYAKGIRLVKWMPPQSIPPDSDQVDEYYRTMEQLNMVLIAHAGPEHTIPTHENNEQWEDWGNPLRFRKALQLGVNVILAHSGHKDKIPDLDNPDLPNVPGYQLFFRLAREAHQKNQSGEWKGKLFGDLGAVTTHYGPEFIKELLLHSHEEGVRLIYGSDYPFTNLIKPKRDAYKICAEAGLLSEDKVQPLQEIRDWNPLLANYVFTKNLELELPSGEKVKFPDSTFTCKFPDATLSLIDEHSWQAFKSLANQE